MSRIWVRSHEPLGNEPCTSSKCRRLQLFFSPAQIRTSTLLVFSYNADSSPSLFSPKHSVVRVQIHLKFLCEDYDVQLCSSLGRELPIVAHPILGGNELHYKPWTLQACFFCAKCKTSALSLTFSITYKLQHVHLKQNFCQNKVVHCRCDLHLGEGTGDKAHHSWYGCHDVQCMALNRTGYL